MNNHPFKELLLEENLEPEQQEQLQNHLETCQDCSSITQAWAETSQLIKKVPQAEPRSGYANRWAVFLAQKQMQAQRRMAWIFFGISLLFISLCIYALYAPSFNQFSPGELLSVLLSQATQVVVSVRETSQFFSIFLNFIPPILPALFWVLLTLSFTSLCMVWVFWMWKILVPKGERV